MYYFKYSIILVIFFSTAYGIDAFAATTAEQDIPVWVEAIGESVGSEYDPPIEVLERARNEAKRKAIDEAVGTFIRSHTLVINGSFEEELIFARVRGRIEKTITISEERDKREPNLWRVSIKALIQPLYPNENEGIYIKLGLSRSALTEGDEVKVLYQTNTDSFIHIFSIAADNSITLLFPNSLQNNNFIKANFGQTFPPDDSPFRLKALTLPEHKSKVVLEKIKVIATKQREIILEKGFQEGLFKVHDARSTGLVMDLARKLNKLDPADWGEAMVTYSIQPASLK